MFSVNREFAATVASSRPDGLWKAAPVLTKARPCGLIPKQGDPDFAPLVNLCPAELLCTGFASVMNARQPGHVDDPRIKRDVLANARQALFWGRADGVYSEFSEGFDDGWIARDGL